MAGVLIADEMGLGKSVQALAVLETTGAYPALIVCPASLRLNWQREASRWLPHRTTEILTGTRAQHGENWADLLVTNYDVLDAWTNALPDLAGIVLDESHYIKNGATQRTRAAIRLSDLMAPAAVRLCLSGTPVVNAPTELIPQLRFLQRLREFGGVGAFRRRYEAGENLDELNRRLRASCMVRRQKDEVLTDLPPKRWATIALDGDETVMRDYRRAEADIVTYLAEEARQAAADSGATTEDARRLAWERAVRIGAAEQLVAIGVLRRLATRAKIASAISWARDFLLSGRRLVVFAHHTEAVAEIAASLGTACIITGATSATERQRAVDAFQCGAEPVIVCSLKAAGVGLTLTAASDVLFVEQGWTPADMDQAADRCHRLGQTDSVTAWVALCAGTIDETIERLIARKREVVGRVTDGEGRASVLGDLLVDLTSRGLDT